MRSQSNPSWPELVAAFLEHQPGPLKIMRIATEALGLVYGTVSPADKRNISVLAQWAGWKLHGRSGSLSLVRPAEAQAAPASVKHGTSSARASLPGETHREDGEAVTVHLEAWQRATGGVAIFTALKIEPS